MVFVSWYIQLLESPIPTTAAVSQKASSDPLIFVALIDNLCLNNVFTFESTYKFGRAGRGGNEAMCIYLRRKGERTPFCYDKTTGNISLTCFQWLTQMRRSWWVVAKLVWTPVVASAPSAGINLSESSLSHLQHRCCSLCMALCIGCPAGRMEADEVVAAILGLETSIHPQNLYYAIESH